ncbi:MAG: ABC transporter permease [Acidimicrobiales bacterium]
MGRLRMSDTGTGTVVTPEASDAGRPAQVSTAGALGFGVAFAVLGLLMVFSFGFGSASGLSSRFVLDTDPLIDFSVPSRATPIVLGVVCVALGAFALTRTLSGRIYLVLGVVLVLFVFTLLTWAARDGSTSLLGLLQGAIIRCIPLALGALAGVLCERAGVINIAIEGMMLGAAFVGSLVASAAGNLWLGMAGGIAIGAALGLLLGVLSIRYTVDQIIGGTVINIFALGLTSFLGAKILTEYQDLNKPGTFRPIEIPLLSKIPFLGPLLFHNGIYVYLMFALVALVWWGLSRTRWGLRVRAVGEHPRAADTVGINVLRTRYRSVVLGGAMAGLAGTFFSLGSAGSFQENMTAGRGFIALAALIFGRWHPVGALSAALVFGFAEELQGRLALLNTPIASDLLLMMPYIVTIFVVAGLVGRARPPAADGQPYAKQ